MPRRAFTLVEMVSSLFIVSVVVTAVASCIALSTQALPDASDPRQATIMLQQVLGRIGDDARFATDVTIKDSGTMVLEIDDRDEDGLPDSVEYTWSGTAGTPLSRKQNDLDAVSIINGVDQVSFAWETDTSSTAATGRRLGIAIRVGTVEVTTTQRCMNVEHP